MPQLVTKPQARNLTCNCSKLRDFGLDGRDAVRFR